MKQDGSAPRGAAGSAARKLIFWEFARASWQYDVVVGQIIIFIFVTPRDWFRDQPRAAGVTLISSNRGHDQLFLEAGLLNAVPAAERMNRAADLIRRKTGKRVNVVRIEAIHDEADPDIKGFIAYTSPRN